MSNKEQQNKQKLPYPNPEGNDTPETPKNKGTFTEEEKGKTPREENPDEENRNRKHKNTPDQNQDGLGKGL